LIRLGGQLGVAERGGEIMPMRLFRNDRGGDTQSLKDQINRTLTDSETDRPPLASVYQVEEIDQKNSETADKITALEEITKATSDLVTSSREQILEALKRLPADLVSEVLVKQLEARIDGKILDLENRIRRLEDRSTRE
jgi:hypothetical protein